MPLNVTAQIAELLETVAKQAAADELERAYAESRLTCEPHGYADDLELYLHLYEGPAGEPGEPFFLREVIANSSRLNDASYREEVATALENLAAYVRGDQPKLSVAS